MKIGDLVVWRADRNPRGAVGICGIVTNVREQVGSVFPEVAVVWTAYGGEPLWFRQEELKIVQNR